MYLYTLLMLAWDQDEDTHGLIRKFLEPLINVRREHRKFSNELKEFMEDCMIDLCAGKEPISRKTNYNIYRICLFNRIFRCSWYEESYCAYEPDRVCGQKDANPCHRLSYMSPGRAKFERPMYDILHINPIPIEEIHPPKYYLEGVENSKKNGISNRYY